MRCFLPAGGCVMQSMYCYETDGMLESRHNREPCLPFMRAVWAWLSQWLVWAG